MAIDASQIADDYIRPINVAMAKHDVTPDRLVKKGLELLEARKPVFQKLKGETDKRYTKKNGRSDVVARTKSKGLNPGETIVQVGVADYGIQIKQEELFLRLGSHFPNEKLDVKVKVGLQLTDEERALCEEAVDIIAARVLKEGK